MALPAAIFAAALMTTLAVAAKYNAAFLAFSFAAAWIEGWRRGLPCAAGLRGSSLRGDGVRLQGSAVR